MSRRVIAGSGFVVPAVLQFMLGVPGVQDRDFSALGAWLYGASPIAEQVLADSVRTFGCRFFQAYGLTEANRKNLETVLRYTHQQGLIARMPALDELFADTDLGDVGSGATPEEF